MLCRMFFTLMSFILYAQIYPALTECNLNCPNGLVTDDNGCEACECQEFCDPDPCEQMVCPYGREMDEDGCDTCQCYEPCSNAFCPPGQTCEVVEDDIPDSYIGQCVETGTMPPSCEAVSCDNTCQYGFKADHRGCHTCFCLNPCENAFCPPDQTCEVVKDDIANTYVGHCVETGTMPTSCEAVSCDNICPYGFKADHRGCQTCFCLNPCENRRCEKNQRCVIDSCGEGDDCRDYTANCVDKIFIGPVPLPSDGLLVNRGPQQRAVMPMEDSLQKALRECCANVSLSGSCLTVCLRNQTVLLSDFTTCLEYPKIWSYLRCVSARAKDSMMKPSTQTDPVPGGGVVIDGFQRLADALSMKDPVKTAMRQCCASASLSGMCLTTCLKKPTLLQSNFSSCLFGYNRLLYLRCISDFLAKATVVNPSMRKECCNTVGLYEWCQQICLVGPNYIFGDFSGCPSDPKIWQYLRCISDVGPLPGAMEVMGLSREDEIVDDGLDAAFRECCANVSMSDTCVSVCLQNPKLFLSHTCLRQPNIYFRCILDVQVKNSKLKQLPKTFTMRPERRQSLFRGRNQKRANKIVKDIHTGNSGAAINRGKYKVTKNLPEILEESPIL